MNTNKIIKISKISLVVTSCLFMLALGFRITFASQLAIKGLEMAELSNEKKHLEKDIADMTYENSQLSSIQYIEEQAKKRGFIELTEKMVSLDTEVPFQVALR